MKRCSRFILSRKGVGLPGMLVATGIGSVLALAIASLMTGMMESQNAVTYRTQADNFTDEVRSLMSSPIACRNSMTGTSLTASTNRELNNLRDGSAAPGAVIYSKGTTHGDRALSIVNMFVKSYVHESGASGWATLELNYLSERKSVGPERITRSIRIKTERDGSNNLTSCIALSKMSDGIWQRTPANQNNIFFQEIAAGGFVGIKTDTPIYPLSVHDTIASRATNRHAVFLADSAGGNPNHAGAFLSFRSRGTLAAPAYPLSGDSLGEISGRDSIDGFAATRFGGASMIIRAAENFNASRKGASIVFSTTATGTDTQIDRLTITPSGAVGVGTMTPQAALDVQGGIRIGNTPACAAANEGTMRYDSGTKAMQFCDGTNWKPIPSVAEIRCYGQGGALNAPYALPHAQCQNQASTSCHLAPNCARDVYNIHLGAGYTSCTWTCKPTP